jgi:hypothetical protein
MSISRINQYYIELERLRQRGDKNEKSIKSALINFKRYFTFSVDNEKVYCSVAEILIEIVAIMVIQSEHSKNMPFFVKMQYY